MKKRLVILTVLLLTVSVSALALSFRYLRPTSKMLAFGEVPDGYVPAELKDVNIDHGSGVVYLAEVGGQRVLPIYVSRDQAQTIAMLFNEVPAERPFMHDLMANLLDYTDLKLEYISVDRLENGIYFSTVVFKNGKSFSIDARPSDSIILALTKKAPMYVSEVLLKEEGTSVHPPLDPSKRGFSV